MTAKFTPHDYNDPRNWPLSRGQLEKFKAREPENYATYQDRWDVIESEQRIAADEEYELSNERLKERIDELENRLRALEPPPPWRP